MSLLSTGVDTNMRDHQGQTPLHLVITSWPSILATGLKPGSKFYTAVMDKHQQAECRLKLLCENGVDVNAEVVEGRNHQTPLHLSVRHRSLAAVRILASYGADVNAVDSYGMTPLHMAAGIPHKDIMSILIRHGADINTGVQQSGNTPLHLAAFEMTLKTRKTTDDRSCISELLRWGADPNIANKAGLTPLMEACWMGNEDLVDMLLGYGADINVLNDAEENCLFLFLNQRSNVRNRSLLGKLLSLTSPLTIHNKNGHLPSTLTQTCFYRQRDQLLELTQQPRTLQGICKSFIYLNCVQRRREELRNVLPDKLFDFVFNHWGNINISFQPDDEHAFSK